MLGTKYGMNGVDQASIVLTPNQPNYFGMSPIVIGTAIVESTYQMLSMPYAHIATYQMQDDIRWPPSATILMAGSN
ncbi:hypothetical protein SeLEV6574_g02587 [Synchytrium endobioticum]|uniref:Uncharacterized protein n=1 Tax=Synchytrium endobioticum TaxID=286115 RepID=A0A507D8B6_9FUNG|nr:hypothetical protein SeLEV6574_g02587 [Synchytrium endobioticum]